MPDSSACAMLRAHLCDERDTCTIILHNARTLLNFQLSFCICAIMRNVYIIDNSYIGSKHEMSTISAVIVAMRASMAMLRRTRAVALVYAYRMWAL